MAKRIAHESVAVGVGIQTQITLGPDATERLVVNYHNIWLSIAIEPESAGANANGKWVLFKRGDITAAVPSIGDGTIEAETYNQMIIACGVWVASNEGPYTMTTQLKTSRNLKANEDLIFANRMDGVSAGNVRLKMMMCANTVAK